MTRVTRRYTHTHVTNMAQFIYAHCNKKGTIISTTTPEKANMVE